MEHQPGMTPKQLSDTEKLYAKVIDEIAAEDSPGMRLALYEQAMQLSELLGVTCPQLGDIGRTVQQAELPGV